MWGEYCAEWYLPVAALQGPAPEQGGAYRHHKRRAPEYQTSAGGFSRGPQRSAGGKSRTEVREIKYHTTASREGEVVIVLYWHWLSGVVQ